MWHFLCPHGTLSATHFVRTNSTADQKADLQVLVELETFLWWHNVV